MIPTSRLLSAMPTDNATHPKYIGWFGNMGGPKQKNVKTYTISPFRQAPLRGIFKGWAVNGSRRLAQQSVYFAAPFAIAYFIMNWAIKDNALRNSKAGHMQGKYA